MFWQQELSGSLAKKLIKVYTNFDNWHELDYRSGDLGYGWIHYGLIRILKPKRVLVIGSGYGYIPAICALACKANKKGIVDFVDAGYDTMNSKDKGRHWGGVGFWKKVDVKKYFGKCKLDKYINFYPTTSRQFKKSYPGRKWNYVYLDGDHSYIGIKSDFNMFWPMIIPGGYLGLHDIYVRQRKEFKYGVIKLWKELKERNLDLISFPGEFGLGLVKK